MITQPPELLSVCLTGPRALGRHAAGVATLRAGTNTQRSVLSRWFTDGTRGVGGRNGKRVLHSTRPRTPGLKIDSVPLSWQRLAARGAEGRALPGARKFPWKPSQCSLLWHFKPTPHGACCCHAPSAGLGSRTAPPWRGVGQAGRCTGIFALALVARHPHLEPKTPFVS